MEQLSHGTGKHLFVIGWFADGQPVYLCMNHSLALSLCNKSYNMCHGSNFTPTMYFVCLVLFTLGMIFFSPTTVCWALTSAVYETNSNRTVNQTVV